MTSQAVGAAILVRTRWRPIHSWAFQIFPFFGNAVESNNDEDIEDGQGDNGA